MTLPDPSSVEASYDGFISYSHDRDTPVAAALQSGMQRLGKRWYQARALRVFRDTTNLSANPNLWDAIETALRRSRYFVLMASPEAAASEWVEREVEVWKSHRSPETFLIVVTGGEISWDARAGDFDWSHTTALPRALRGWFQHEPLWLSLGGVRSDAELSMTNREFRSVVCRLAARMHDKAPDTLDSEDLQEHAKAIRRWRLGGLALAMFAVIALVAGSIAWWQGDLAQQRARVALSRALAAEAQIVADADPWLASQLALYSYASDPTSESKAALARLVNHEPHVRTYVVPGGEQVAKSYSPTNPPLGHVALSGDGSLLAYYFSAASDRIVLWDTRSGRRVGLIGAGPMGSEYSGLALDAAGHRMIKYSDGEVWIWDIADGRRRHVLSAGEWSIDGAISPDGRWVATATGDAINGPSSIVVWDADSGREITRLAPTSDYSFPELRFSADSSRLRVVKVNERNVQEFDLRTRTWAAPRPLFLPEEATYAKLSGADRVYVESQTMDPTTNLTAHTIDSWSLATGFKNTFMAVPTGAAQTLSVSADGRTVAAGGENGDIIEVSGSGTRELAGVTTEVRETAVSDDGAEVAAMTASGGVTLASDPPRGATPLMRGRDRLAGVSRDGRFGLVSRGDRAELWNLSGGYKQADLRIAVEPGVALDVSADGSRVAVRTPEELTLFGGRSHQELASMDTDEIGTEGTVDLLPGGGRVVVDDEYGQWIELDMLNPGSEPKKSTDTSLDALSADGRVLAKIGDAVESDQSKIEIWRKSGGTFERDSEVTIPGGFTSLGDTTRDLALNPDGSTLAVSDVDGRVLLFDTQRPGTPTTLNARTFWADSDITFSADGQILVQHNNSDGALQLWDVATGEQLATWAHPEPPPPPLKLGESAVEPNLTTRPDGRILAVRADGVAVHWNVDLAQWLGTVCRLAGGDLGETQRDRYLAGVDLRTPCPS